MDVRGLPYLYLCSFFCLCACVKCLTVLSNALLQTVYAVPILTFAFVCHPAVLPMYEELKE